MAKRWHKHESILWNVPDMLWFRREMLPFTLFALAMVGVAVAAWSISAPPIARAGIVAAAALVGGWLLANRKRR